MERVTTTDVRVVIDTDLTDADISTLIDIASRLVDDELVPLGRLSSDRLRDVELYLAAHFVAVREPRERVGFNPS